MSGGVHLIGIGGSGLSPIATVLHQRGLKVTGSDRQPSEYSRVLEELGIQVFYGHAADNLGEADLVIVSSAVPEENVELQAARQRGIRIARRQDYLGELTAGQRTAAVAGTHGKTTTSGLLAWLLAQAGLEPGYIVGGLLPDLGSSGAAGAGDYFVIEADEYDHAFLGLRPEIGVITNIEHDHPDCFPTLADVQDAFDRFAHNVQELLLVCADDPLASQMRVEGLNNVRYGLHPQADWRAEELRPNSAGGMDFLVLEQGRLHGLFRTRLPGRHNVLNALAAICAARALGVEMKVIREALVSFHGAGRRFEVLGEAQGVVVVDDYAHHPTEIMSTLQGARLRYPDSALWAVFQPHTYSRTRTLLGDLGAVFAAADHVVVLDIFAAREPRDPAFGGENVAAAIDHPDVHHIGGIQEAAAFLQRAVAAPALVITLSAGDGNRVGKLLLEGLRGEQGGRR